MTEIIKRWRDLKEKFHCYVTIPWPTGYIIDEKGEEKFSANPHDLWRPYLEQEVGEQKVDWDWEVSYNVANAVDIFFQSDSEAMLFKLTWI